MAEPTDTFPRSTPEWSLWHRVMLFLGKANLDINIVGLTTHRCPYPRQAREHTVVPGNVRRQTTSRCRGGRSTEPPQ
jgi:hypothetical protein